jgi:hypothetical protein
VRVSGSGGPRWPFRQDADLVVICLGRPVFLTSARPWSNPNVGIQSYFHRAGQPTCQSLQGLVGSLWKRFGARGHPR